MPEVSTVNNTDDANVSTINNIAAASISTVNNITWPSAGFYNNVVGQSAMFDIASSTYLIDTAITFDSDNEVSFSVWCKRSKLALANRGTLFYMGNAGGTNNLFIVEFRDTDKLRILSSGTGEGITTDGLFRDCSGWYHIFAIYNDTDATEADRLQIWVNGTRQSVSGTYPSQNKNIDETRVVVGAIAGGTREFEGYMADLYVIDGVTVAATDFGESKNGVWIPKDYSGAYGSGGFKLDFSDNTSFGDDTSGNGNDLTDNNFGTDHQVNDNPEDNYCVMDINNTRSNITTFSEGGLRVGDAGAAWHSSMGTFLLKTGKWYFEVDVGSDADDIKVGIGAAGELSGDIQTADTDPGASSLNYIMHCDASGAVYNMETGGAATGDDNLDAPAADDVMTIAVDADAGKIWFGLYNAGSGHVWGDFGATGVGDPANGNNPSFSSIDFDLYDYVPIVGVNAHSTSTINFGQRTFSGTAPTGFNALSTSNMGTPDVADPQDEYVNVLTYTGDGAATRAITGAGFQPDMVWIKNRDATDSWMAFDDQRGATYPCKLNDGTPAEAADADSLTSFDADGFSVGADVKVNTNTENYVAYCWQQQTNLLDVVLFSGTGVAHAENHSLGSTPKMFAVWNRTSGREIGVYHYANTNKTDPETDYLRLDLSNAGADLNTHWNDTAPTSTQFTVGTGLNTNESGKNMVAWLWGDIAGVQKCFHYEGNANAAGPYVYCGFSPQLVIIKNVDNADGWYVFDNKRETYNPRDVELRIDTNAAELDSTNNIDFYANGFKLKNALADINTNNSSHIGIAFAEQPFAYANAVT